MKQEFISRKFNSESMSIIETAIGICENYAKQGFDLSLRQLYYQFVSKDLLPNTEQNYKRLGSIISDARLAGLLDWKFIKDRGRELIENNHWLNPGQILDAVADQFRLDTWKSQPNFVMVMVEKQALEGVLEPTCRDLDISFIANKGYSSSSTMYEIGRNLFYQTHKFHREAHVIYLGDHDPSGIDMTRDVIERLAMFAEAPVTVHRVALNIEQVEEYNPPENPAKLTDSRAQGYIEEFGEFSWELDALEPSLLASLVRDKVEELRDDDLYEEIVARQEKWRDELSALAERYNEGDES